MNKIVSDPLIKLVSRHVLSPGELKRVCLVVDEIDIKLKRNLLTLLHEQMMKVKF